MASIHPRRILAIAALEAAYRVDIEDDAAWLMGIASQLGPALEEVQGFAAWQYTVVGRRVDARGFCGTAPRGWERAVLGSATEGTARMAGLYRSGPCVSILEQIPNAHRTREWKHQKELAHADFVALNAVDGEGHGAIIGAAHMGPALIDAASRGTISRFSSHVGAAMRLRRRLAEGASPADAVLELSGTLVHAESGARAKEMRAALRQAAVSIDRARSRRGGSEADETLSRWKPLVAAQWSLVDSFESDGRHYMVARRNAPHCKRPRDLTVSERRVATLAALGHSNKLIAYELGTTTAAVAMQLTRSARKLGVKSRVELIRAMQPTLGPMPEAS